MRLCEHGFPLAGPEALACRECNARAARAASGAETPSAGPPAPDPSATLADDALSPQEAASEVRRAQLQAALLAAELERAASQLGRYVDRGVELDADAMRDIQRARATLDSCF